MARKFIASEVQKSALFLNNPEGRLNLIHASCTNEMRTTLCLWPQTASLTIEYKCEKFCVFHDNDVAPSVNYKYAKRHKTVRILDAIDLVAREEFPTP